MNFGRAESGLVLVTILVVAAFLTYKCHATCRYRCCGGKRKQSNKKLQRAAIANLANLATALSPHIQQKALALQAGGKDSKPKEPKSIKKEKQVEELVMKGRNSPRALPTIQEDIGEVTDVECGKPAPVVPTHTYTLPRTTSSNSPPLLLLIQALSWGRKKLWNSVLGYTVPYKILI